jgi:UDP-N-acetylglucosamine 2-epimerase (non-hydrolysing)
MAEKQHIAVIVGTRPEAIKMAPVITALAARPDTVRLSILSTGQHREMLAQALSLFSIVPDVDLQLMTPDQSLASLTQGAIGGLTACLGTLRPDMLLVQGDTTTVFAASLAAFYLGVKVGHVEAGLRSHDIANPFPEEANRRLTSVLTTLHFAPTPLARDELLREGHDPASIVVTGNTVVDALLGLSATLGPGRCPLLERLAPQAGRFVLVTSHRRESWGQALTDICDAVADLARAFPDVTFLYPVHRNPHVREVVFATLQGLPNVLLTDPLDYQSFVLLMRDATLILTDSGGVQEEAPTFRTPVLVLRRVTERPEASRMGLARLVGTDRAVIVAEASKLLTDEAAREAMRRGPNPYGDGRAAQRIVAALKRFAAGERPVLPEDAQFHNQDTTARS